MENDKLNMCRFYSFLICFFVSSALMGQGAKNQSKEKWVAGLGTTFNNHSFYEGSNQIYTELTLDYRFTTSFSGGVYVGHQTRNYLFPSATPSGLRLYAYDQSFMPIGIRGTFHLTTFVSDNFFKGKINLENWDIYITYLGGVVFNTVTEDFERSNLPEDQIDYTLFNRDDDINYNLGILTGVTYYPFKNIGFFVDFGVGPMGNLNSGVKARF